MSFDDRQQDNSLIINLRSFIKTEIAWYLLYIVSCGPRGAVLDVPPCSLL